VVKGVVNLIFGKRKSLVNLAFTRLFVATADILDTVSNGFTLNETLAKCETLSAK